MGGHAELRNSTAVARVEQRLWPGVGGKIEGFFRGFFFPFPSSFCPLVRRSNLYTSLDRFAPRHYNYISIPDTTSRESSVGAFRVGYSRVLRDAIETNCATRVRPPARAPGPALFGASIVAAPSR